MPLLSSYAAQIHQSDLLQTLFPCKRRSAKADVSIYTQSESEFPMLIKLFGGLAIAAGLIAAGIAGNSATTAEPTCTKGACCSEDCCKDCPDCSCECDCCKNCEAGCECPNKS